MRRQAVCTAFVAYSALHTLALCVVMLLIGTAHGVQIQNWLTVSLVMMQSSLGVKSLRMQWMHFRF